MTILNRLILLVIFMVLIGTRSSHGQCLKTGSSSDISISRQKPAEWLAEQGFDTTSTEEILNVLDEGTIVESVYSAQYFAERGYHKVVPKILKRYQQVDNKKSLALSLLETLRKLGYPDTNELLQEYAEQSFKSLPATRHAYRKAVRMLFKEKEYSQLINIINKIKDKVGSKDGDAGYLYTLTCAFNSSRYQGKIEEMLIFILENYQDAETRKMVAYYARFFSGSDELVEALKKTASNDSNSEVREYALRTLQDTYPESSSLGLTLKNIKRETSPEVLEDYLSILYTYYTPRSLYSLKNLAENSSNSIIREKASNIYSDYWWLHFEPYGKAFDYTVPRTLDSLKAHTREIASYDWLGNRGFVKELNTRLDKASRHLAGGDSAKAAKQIANYQERLQEVYSSKKGKKKGRYIAKDGYKFLFKNAAYLLTKLPPHPSNNKNKEGSLVESIYSAEFFAGKAYEVREQALIALENRCHETDILPVSSAGVYLHKVGIDTTSIEAVKAALKAPDNYISSEAALFLAQKKGKSTLPLILKRFKKVDRFNVGSYSFLQALKISGYKNLTSLTREFADSIYHKINLQKEFLGGEPLYISTVELLFQENDYSHFKNVQTILKQEADSTNANTSFLYLFEEVSDVRSLENEIINTVIYLLEHSKDKELRLAAVNLSDEFPNSQKLKQALKETVREDPRHEVRLRALHKLRFNFWESNILQLALKNIHKLESMEKAEEFLNLIARTNTPESLYEIKKLSEEGANAPLQNLASKYYKQYWDVYFLPFPENFVSDNEKKNFTLNRTIDSLKAHTREIASYDWLGNRGFVKELNTRLDKASRHLAGGDSTKAARQVARYELRLQRVFTESSKNDSPRFVRGDGYKFLYKNAAYLLEQLD